MWYMDEGQDVRVGEEPKGQQGAQSRSLEVLQRACAFSSAMLASGNTADSTGLPSDASHCRLQNIFQGFFHMRCQGQGQLQVT